MNSTMRRNSELPLGVALVLGVVLVSCVVYPTQNDVEHARSTAIEKNDFEHAQSAAMVWIGSHRDEWPLSIVDSESEGGFRRMSWSTSACGEGDTPFTSVEYRDSNTWIQFGVDCPQLQASTAQGIQEALRYFTLQSLPHGVEYPGWTFRILTPSSDVHEDVEVLEVSHGRIKLSVHTELYAIFGNDERSHCATPADGSCPAQCCFLLEHRIPLKLDLNVGFDPAQILKSQPN